MSISSDILAAVIGALIAVFTTIFLEYLRNRGNKKSNSLALAYALEKFAVMAAEYINGLNIVANEYRENQDPDVFSKTRWPAISVPESIDFNSISHHLAAQVLDLLLQARVSLADLQFTLEHLDPVHAAQEESKVFGELGCMSLSYAKALRKDAGLPDSVLLKNMKIADILENPSSKFPQ